MNKMNKKGFTLIEMLVVIAIIAILVSIIVPVVGNSTKKAAAATNAANLRAAAASISVEYMEGKLTETSGTLSGYSITPPVARTNGGVTGGTFVAKLENGSVNCYFGSNGVTYYADIADDGLSNNSAGGTASQGQ